LSTTICFVGGSCFLDVIFIYLYKGVAYVEATEAAASVKNIMQKKNI